MTNPSPPSPPPYPDLQDKTLFPDFLDLPLTLSYGTTALSSPRCSTFQHSSPVDHSSTSTASTISGRNNAPTIIAQVKQNVSIVKPTLIATDSSGHDFAITFPTLPTISSLSSSPSPTAADHAAAAHATALAIWRPGHTIVVPCARRVVSAAAATVAQQRERRNGANGGEDQQEKIEKEKEEEKGKEKEIEKEIEKGISRQSSESAAAVSDEPRAAQGQGFIAIVTTAEAAAVGHIPASLSKIRELVRLTRDEKSKGKANSGEGRRGMVCAVCGKENNADAHVMRRCAGCRRVRYCGKECQFLAWKKDHAKQCKIYRAMNEIWK